jgi:ribosome maturation factor RimP
MAEDMKKTLTDLLEPLAEEHGLELVLLEVSGPRNNPLVRMYMDREGGIGIEDIAMANKWIKAVLDELPELTRGYTLEVSSPGIERPLTKLRDFERFAGSAAKVTTAQEIDGRGRFTGMLQGVEGETVLLGIDDQTVRIPFRDITKARLRVEIDFGKEGTADDGL